MPDQFQDARRELALQELSSRYIISGRVEEDDISIIAALWGETHVEVRDLYVYLIGQAADL